MSTRFALSIDGVRDGGGLPAIELTLEPGSQLRRIRRHDPNPASIAERFNAVTAVESGSQAGEVSSAGCGVEISRLTSMVS